MHKSKVKKPKWRNQFMMKGNEGLYYQKQVHVKFDMNEKSSSSSSSYDSQSSSSYNKENCSIIPAFNNDRVTYTPSFYLPYKQIKKTRFIEKHRKKEEKYQEISASSILVPKPRKRTYCHSCVTQYSDYLRHISRQEHKQNILKHSMHLEIVELCNKFSNQGKTAQAKSNLHRAQE